MRLIDADLLAKTIEKAQMEGRKVNVLSLINDSPTIDSLDLDVHIGGRCCGKRQRLLDELRPKGKWIEESVPVALVGAGNGQYRCSNCGHADIQAKTQEVPYCWWCGARMER